MDLVIEARAFIRDSLTPVDVGIDTETGKIVAVKKSLSGGTRVRLASHEILLPSGIDWHVHLRDPGHPAKEDFATGTLAAALGGMGTVLDMPNTVPVVDRASRLREKYERIAPKACVDYGLWATISRETGDPAGLLRDAVGAKLYLAPTTGVEGGPTDEELRRALEACRHARRWAIVHAETPPPPGVEPASLLAHHESRPSQGEVDAIRRVARLAPEPAHVHIAHATTRDAVDAARGAGMSAGATPHHLLLSHTGRREATLKVNPPLRSEPERAALHEAFAQGRIPFVESDHAPHTSDEKSGRFQDAPSGMPGVETLLPLLLRRAKHGELPLHEVVLAACERPAAALGLPKGRIAQGYDADLVVVDTRDTRTLRASELASKCGWSAFEGWPMLPVTRHYQRGEPIVEGGAFVGKRGRGRRIDPAPLPSAAART